MVETAKVIVLRSIDFQESSKIITVLSDKHGKMALIAKGAKRPKNKLAGLIEPGAILEAVYYYKQNRGVQTLSEATTLYRTMNFRMDIEKASILYSTLELVNQLVHDNEVNLPVFDFMNKFIPWLGDLNETKASVFPYVQVRLAELVGVGLRVLAENSESYFLNISNGSVDKEPLEELSYKLTANQSAFLINAIETKNSKIFNSPFDNGELKQLIHHLDVYFKYHIEGFKDRRSDAIFEQMIQ